MAYRLLLERGVDPVEALALIRSARPIAAVRFAGEALDHFHRCHLIPPSRRSEEQRRVQRWFAGNSFDVATEIARIRAAEEAA
jgi:hypothetical protein